MNFKFSIRAKMLTYILSASAIIYIIALVILSNDLKQSSVNNAKEFAETYGKSLANEAESTLEVDLNITKALVNSFEGLKGLPKDELVSAFNNLLRSNLAKYNNYLTSWVSWELDYMSQDWVKLHGRITHLFFREGGEIMYDILYKDTTEENYGSDYYRIKVNGKETFVDPYWDTFGGKDHFISSVCMPIKDRGKFVGLAGFDIPLDRFNQLSVDVGKYNAKSIVVSNSGKIIAHPNRSYVNKNIQDMLGNQAELQGVTGIVKNGKPKEVIIKNEDTGEETHYFFTPILIGDSDEPWSMIVKVPWREVLDEANNSLYKVIWVGIVGLVLLSLLIWYFANNITFSLKKTTGILKSLALGDIDDSYKLSVNVSGEIGEMANSVNTLIEGLNSTANFAKEIGKGNLIAEFNQLSNKDVLGESLIDMRESLVEAKKEEEKRKVEDAKQNWATQGLAKFGDILRQSSDNMEDFTYNIISNLVKYLDANQGGLFVINEDENKEKYIELVSCYAYNRKKYMDKKIQYGEGLIGRCVLEAETIYMIEVPEDYIKITSGLGEENPRCILIVPLILNSEVYGVIELASFRQLEKHEISFVEKIGESIASTLSNVKINIRTAKLLEESKIQAEELAAQEEEMRQNLEELQATQEESARKEAEMSGILAALNASLLVAECDVDSNVITINNGFANALDLGKDHIVGRTYKEIVKNYGIDPERVDQIFNSVKSNEIVKNIFNLTINEKETWINQTFAPIVNNDGKVYKVLLIGNDITESKLQEKQVQDLLKESQLKNEELQRMKDDDEKKSKEMLETIESHRATLYEILNQIPAKVFLKDKDAKMLIVNDRVAKAHGCKAEELIGLSDFDFFEKETAQMLFDEEEQIKKEGGRTFEQKEYVNDADVYLKTTKMPFYIHYLDQTGLLGIQLDITDIRQMQIEIEDQNRELKKIQAEMANEKALMDCMMENIPDNIYFKDKESRFLRISKNMLELFSAESYDDVLGKQDFDFFSGEHAQQAFDDEMGIIKTGKPIVGLIEKETFEDGSISWVDTTKMPLLDNVGNIIGTFGISRDVTKIKNMEIDAKTQKKVVTELEAKIHNTEPIINGFTLNLPVLVYYIDVKKNITQIDGAGLKLLGKIEKELIGKSFTSVFPDSKTKIEKEIKGKVSFKTKGKYNNESWELVHYIYVNNLNRDCLIGYAYKSKLI